jgi:hypothetical protein
MKNRKILFLTTCCFLLSFLGCKKEFLDKKPSTTLNVPTTLTDIQMLLDNVQELNFSVGLGDLSSDNLYLEFNTWKNQPSPYSSNSYIWAKDLFAGQGNIPDWNRPYKTVLTANVALEQLRKIQRTNANNRKYDELKAMALFIRSYMFFDLAQVFALPYDEHTASVDWGIPLRLEPDINKTTTRMTIKDTYEQILTDVFLARDLVQTTYDLNFLNRPSKASVYGFLSRIFLTMRKYDKAGLYADSSLYYHDKLIDYNSLSKVSKLPFNLVNDEMLYPCFLVTNYPISSLFKSQGYSIDTLLYNSYHPNDLRKQILFSINGKSINRKGGYGGARLNENSIATDELFLTRAECFARAGNTQQALNDLNKLLSKRFITGTYKDKTNLSGDALLDTILLERRKELVNRGTRWNDIRRLNKEGANLELIRNLNGQIFKLAPNDKKYALPIPPDVISYTLMPQNNR